MLVKNRAVAERQLVDTALQLGLLAKAIALGVEKRVTKSAEASDVTAAIQELTGERPAWSW